MLRYLIALLFCFHTFCWSKSQVDEPSVLAPPSNPLDIFDGEPNAIVNGCVNVISGDYIDFQEDITLPGIEPLSLKRFYFSSLAHFILKCR